MRRIALPDMRVRMRSWPRVMRSRNMLISHVVRNHVQPEPRATPVHSHSMTLTRSVSIPIKVNSHSIHTRVPGLVTDIRNPFRNS